MTGAAPSAALAGSLSQAAQVVARVAAGASLAAEIDRFDQDGAGPASALGAKRAALIDLAHGTLRRFGRVQALVRALSRHGGADGLVEALLWCALYALESGRYRDYTVVDQAVRACALLGKWPAKGYVNAVLRAFLRERSSLEARLQHDAEARHWHPLWWIELLRAAYPQQWNEVLAAGNTHPPMCLRVNRRRSDPAAYAERLASAGIAARPLGDGALLLERPLPVERLPGFAEGLVSVQDAGAQRAAPLLGLVDGQRVLDACAAPGGKSAHLLELAAVSLTALDVDAARLARAARNLERLGLSAELRCADCSTPERWWDGVPFERVLADVPCSASGVARRHPDIKWLRRAADLEAFAARQAAMLDALWRVLAPGGKLLYVTCSVFPQENDAVVDAFVARARDARRAALPEDTAALRLPGPEHDGFYYSLIEKSA
jgi:16S rRNA (cytosine967-C5)-methyltransferase